MEEAISRDISLAIPEDSAKPSSFYDNSHLSDAVILGEKRGAAFLT